MGFLKFLKKPEAKEKDLASDDLEIPPPPEIGSLSSDLPYFVGPRLEGSSVTPLRPLDASAMTGYRQKPVEQPQLLDKLPELKPFDYGGEEKKAYPQPLGAPASPFQQLTELKPERQLPAPVIASPMTSPDPMPWDTLKQPAISHPAPAFELHKPAAHEALNALQFESPVFISAYKYRQIIEDIDNVIGRKSLASETAAMNDAEGREYDKLGTCLEDMQRKLMFIDKSLFEV